MITRIELTNFMSHAHTVIEPASGLTVLVGPNNCGKSAIVAALQILCGNDNSTYVMRHGEKECSVRVTTDDGHEIEWRRKKSPSYVIDGTEFSRLTKGGYPDELHQALRLPKAQAGEGVEFDVHFGTQKDPIFLLRNPSADAAKFFASSSDAIRLVEMQKRHKDKHAEAQRQKSRLEAESKQLTAELELLEPAVELNFRCQEAEELFGEIQSIVACIEDAESHVQTWESGLGIAARHRSEVQSLMPLLAPPALADVDAFADLIGKLLSAQESHALAAGRAVALAELSTPPQLQDNTALELLIDRIAEVAKAYARHAKDTHFLEALETPPAVVDVASLAAAIEQLAGASDQAAAIKACSTVLDTILPPPELDDASPLAACIVKLSQTVDRVRAEKRVAEIVGPLIEVPTPRETGWLEDRIQRLDHAERAMVASRETLGRLQAEFDCAVADLRRFAEENVCPTCGNPLDADRVVATAGSGGVHAHV
jgi:exonuclease SbcC